LSNSDQLWRQIIFLLLADGPAGLLIRSPWVVFYHIGDRTPGYGAFLPLIRR